MLWFGWVFSKPSYPAQRLPSGSNANNDWNKRVFKPEAISADGLLATTPTGEAMPNDSKKRANAWTWCFPKVEVGRGKILSGVVVG
jgi:hypothetical protein